jgi:hypothetical protein
VRDNHLDTIKAEKGIVHDRAGTRIQANWGSGEYVAAGGSGMQLEEESQKRFQKILDTFYAYAMRQIAKHSVELLVVLDAPASAEATLDGQALIDEGGTRGLRRILPGKHQIRVGGVTGDLDVSKARGVKVTVKGDALAFEDLDLSERLVRVHRDGVRVAIDKYGLVSVTPDPNGPTFVVLSGPPGGPFGISIGKCDLRTVTDEELQKLAKQHYGSARAFAEGKTGSVSVSGTRREAVTCLTGESHAHSVHILIVLPGKDGHGALVDFTCGWPEKKAAPSPDEVAKVSSVCDLLNALEVALEPE